MGRDIPGEWWALFHSPKLNQLMEEGISNSPNLEAAKDALAEARDLLRAQIGKSYLPSLGLDLSGAKTKSLDIFDAFSGYTTKLSAMYIFDLFGGQRRLVETYRAKEDYARYEMLAAYLTLTSNIALRYINIASLQAQIRTTVELIQDQEKILSIARQQYQVVAPQKPMSLRKKLC